jgi:hypothetical protein
MDQPTSYGAEISTQPGALREILYAIGDIIWTSIAQRRPEVVLSDAVLSGPAKMASCFAIPVDTKPKPEGNWLLLRVRSESLDTEECPVTGCAMP